MNSDVQFCKRVYLSSKIMDTELEKDGFSLMGALNTRDAVGEFISEYLKEVLK